MFPAAYRFRFTDLNFISDRNTGSFIVYGEFPMPLDRLFIQRVSEYMFHFNRNRLLHANRCDYTGPGIIHGLTPFDA
jgi:hypothetical protein